MKSTPAIAFDQVSKWYGQVIGVNDVSLAIDGGVTGILGMNGGRKVHPLQATNGEVEAEQWSSQALWNRPLGIHIAISSSWLCQ